MPGKLPPNFTPIAPQAAPAPISPIAAAPEPEPEPEPEPHPFFHAAARTGHAGDRRRDAVHHGFRDRIVPDWPDAVRNEINASKLSGSWIGLPLNAVEGIIKGGKLAFPLERRCAPGSSRPFPRANSPYDTTMLELPLKVVTPLFLAELKATRTQKRVSMDEAIPDLFFNSQPAEATVVSPSAPAAPQPPPILPKPAAVPPPAPAPIFTAAPAAGFTPVPKAPAPKAAPAAPARSRFRPAVGPGPPTPIILRGATTPTRRMNPWNPMSRRCF